MGLIISSLLDLFEFSIIKKCKCLAKEVCRYWNPMGEINFAWGRRWVARKIACKRQKLV